MSFIPFIYWRSLFDGELFAKGQAAVSFEDGKGLKRNHSTPVVSPVIGLLETQFPIAFRSQGSTENPISRQSKCLSVSETLNILSSYSNVDKLF